MRTAILDFDYTMYDGYARYDLGFLMEEAGLIERGFTDEINALQESYERGDLTYNQKFTDDKKVFSRYYKGLGQLDIERFIREEFPLDEKVYSWVPELVTMLHEREFIVVVLSGCWDLILEEVQNKLGFDAFISSGFQVEKGKLTGKYSQILDHVSKKNKAVQLLEGTDYSVGLGDSVADFEFLSRVNRAFLYQPRPDAIEYSKKFEVDIVDEGSVITKIRGRLDEDKAG